MIVESPAKARKIGGYLGDDYIVEASIGHIRDLPQRAADIPKEVKKFPWSREGVDIENGFADHQQAVKLRQTTNGKQRRKD